MRIAIADLGSHTFHLLCARIDDSGAIVPELSRKHTLRLGASLTDGRIPSDAWTRAVAALEDLSTTVRGFDGPTFAVGTSVLRESSDGEELARVAHRILGVPVQILTGDEEAELVFLGARSALPPAVDRVAVIDLGGGSMEVALGDASAITQTWSLPLGVLRLRNVPFGELAEKITTDAGHVWSAVQAYKPSALVLTGGSARLIAKLLRSTAVAAITVRELARHLAGLSELERFAVGVPSERADTIVTAAAIFAEVIDACGGVAEISPRGLREGFIVRATRPTSAAL